MKVRALTNFGTPVYKDITITEKICEGKITANNAAMKYEISAHNG